MDLLREEHSLTGNEVGSPPASQLVDIYSRCVKPTPIREVLAVDFHGASPTPKASLSSASPT